jgi:hypothetical protein
MSPLQNFLSYFIIFRIAEQEKIIMEKFFLKVYRFSDNVCPKKGVQGFLAPANCGSSCKETLHSSGKFIF